MADDSLFSPSLETIPRIEGAQPRVGVLASGSGTNFEAIARAVQSGELDIDLACLVCNNPDASALGRAETFGVEALLIDHRAYPNRESFDADVLELLESFDVDWVVMAGWMRLVTGEFIDAYEGRMLNIHPSLLPAFRGLDAVGQALEAGVRITGVTVHHVVREMDAGPVVAQAAVPVFPEDDRASLHSRIQEQEHRLFPRAIALAVNAAQEH
ncbi:MAG: phosphoribosylglycinamide formyltransferase [Myxococcota bacterium]